MTTSDQDNESSPPPSEQARDVELPNDSLNNGDSADAQPGQAGQNQNRGDGQGHRPKRRIARRKIRVELIKEPMPGQTEDRADTPMEEAPGGGARRAACAAAPGKPSPDRRRLRGSGGAGERRPGGYQR